MPKKDEDKVWSMVAFDLPTLTKKQRRAANRFRNLLLDLGYQRLQLSVYVQMLPYSTNATSIVRTIKSNLPPGGVVQIFRISDGQWSKAIRFRNGFPDDPEPEPEVLRLF